MTDAPSFPRGGTASSFVDDEIDNENQPKSKTVVASAPVRLSELPDIVLVRFTQSVSPYTAGEVAAVTKAYATAALRSGWVDLADAGKGLGRPVPRPKSADDTRRRQPEAPSSSGIVAELKAQNDKLTTDLKKATDAVDDLAQIVSDLQEAVALLGSAEKKADTPAKTDDKKKS